LSHMSTQSNIVDASIIKACSMTRDMCIAIVGNQIIMNMLTTFVIMLHCILVLFTFHTLNKISTLEHWINSSMRKRNSSDSNRSSSSGWFDRSEVIDNVLANLQNHCQRVCVHVGTDVESQHRETSKVGRPAIRLTMPSPKLCQDFQTIQSDQRIEVNWTHPKPDRRSWSRTLLLERGYHRKNDDGGRRCWFQTSTQISNFTHICENKTMILLYSILFVLRIIHALIIESMLSISREIEHLDHYSEYSYSYSPAIAASWTANAIPFAMLWFVEIVFRMIKFDYGVEIASFCRIGRLNNLCDSAISQSEISGKIIGIWNSSMSCVMNQMFSGIPWSTSTAFVRLW
jgi:hypothetical protein